MSFAAGTGKTSVVTALAGELGLDIYVVTLSSPSMTDETLRSLLNSAAERCILLLEDVDAAFVGREASSEGPSGRLSFSGLLNAIDGVRRLPSLSRCSSRQTHLCRHDSFRLHD